MRTGELGFWWRSLGGQPPARAALDGDAEADVAIVGAGYTGLWTAYYLKLARPSLRIVVLEAERAGFGASGRNGGWVSGFFSGPPRLYVQRGGRAAYVALQREMFATVSEIGEVLAREQIDADFLACGQLQIALNSAQVARVRERARELHSYGFDERDLRELSSDELDARVRVRAARMAAFSPHVARVHPAKLLVGLAHAVERSGVAIHERTPVRELTPGEARTDRGVVRARWIVRATEAYTASLRGLRRALVPINSSMIVTEPLAPSVWEEIGWQRSELIDDAAHVFAYLQRTADGRIAIGGRGVPYRFGSRTDGDGQIESATVDELRTKLHTMFPVLAGATIEHAWSGVLGVARDWGVSVDADPRSGLAWAGGYAGEGVAAANLAARTLRDLLLDEPSELTTLAWVGRRPRRWEPEPLRWTSIRGVYALYRLADRGERRSGRSSRLGRLVDRASGRG
jgi:glycine/D-amino acid oxidase-like deaminating enzyme